QSQEERDPRWPGPLVRPPAAAGGWNPPGRPSPRALPGLRFPTMAEELCKHCGAPRVAGYAACKFCRTPFVENSQTNAIPCPRCNTLNEMGAQRCVQCQTWVGVQ